MAKKKNKKSRHEKKEQARKRSIKQAQENIKRASQALKDGQQPSTSQTMVNESMQDFLSEICAEDKSQRSQKSSNEFSYSLSLSKKISNLQLIQQFDPALTNNDVKGMLSLNLEHIDMHVDPNAPMNEDNSNYDHIEYAINLKRQGRFDEAFRTYQSLYDTLGLSHVLCKGWAKTSLLCGKYELAIKLFRMAAYIMHKRKKIVDYQCLGGATVVFSRQRHKKAFNLYKTAVRGFAVPNF